jgi:hypothetical protein
MGQAHELCKMLAILQHPEPGSLFLVGAAGKYISSGSFVYGYSNFITGRYDQCIPCDGHSRKGQAD